MHEPICDYRQGSRKRRIHQNEISNPDSPHDSLDPFSQLDISLALMFTAHQKAVTTLSAFDDPEAVPPVLEAMEHAFVIATAKEALVRMGSRTENAVMDHFEKVNDDSTRRKLLEVLKEIGTEKSENFLTKPATGDDVSLRSSAQRALDAVRSR